MSNRKKPNIFVALGIGGTFSLLLLVFNTFTIVEPGFVGVVTHFGAVQDEMLPEGLHMVMPFRTKVMSLNTRIQKIEAGASASSKDLQIVTSKVALNFQLDPSKANIIFQNLGKEYQETIIAPTIQESVKSATAQYTAEQLITKRPEVKSSIYKSIKERLKKNNIIVNEFSIVDFSFSREFNRAIEEKQVAEQAALRAKNDLDRIKIEATQVEAKADGEAKARLAIARAESEAQKLLRETIDEKILMLRSIEKWDGVLPVSMGSDGSGTFFDVVSAAAMKNKTGKKKVSTGMKSGFKRGQ
ncbi:MAG: prohibitin family protein [Planctomycetota bacterium]|nr:prohibitin family protein [Planctomycetota bacterium]